MQNASHHIHRELSDAQLGLWIEQSANPDDVSYNIPWIFELTGELDRVALNVALDSIIQRHSILRTRYELSSSGPRQVIDTESKFSLIDSFVTPQDKEVGGSYEELVVNFAKRPFNLEADHPVRGMLVQRSDSQFALCMIFHHIAWDETSAAIFERELSELYSAHVERRSAVLPDLPIQYADYAATHQTSSPDDTRYWREKLKGLPSSAFAQIDTPHESTGSTFEYGLPKEFHADVKSTAADLGVTPFAVFLAAFARALSEETNETDLLIGTPVTTRDHPDLQNLIGYFVNLLPIRITVSPNETPAELIYQVADNIRAALTHTQVTLAGAIQREHGAGDQTITLNGVISYYESTPLIVAGDHLRIEKQLVHLCEPRFEWEFLITSHETEYVGYVDYRRRGDDDGRWVRMNDSMRGYFVS